MSPADLAQVARDAARELGFSACGVTRPAPSPTASHYDSWISRGFHGEMAYMARQGKVRRDPSLAWPPARSIVVVLHNYYSGQAPATDGYRLAKYAEGEDYHTVTRRKLDRLSDYLRSAAGAGEFRSYVDAGPLPERDLAQQAGLGWMGKNTMLIHPRLGSFTFIGSLLTDLELTPDAPFEADRCGTCTRCLDACPTDAFPEPRVLDATRCISYLTIESRSEIPETLRAAVGDNLFGCDICQDVCPWNERFAAPTNETAFRPDPERDWPTLDEILAMDEAGFDRRFGDTAFERTRLAGLQRNARVVSANRQA